MLHVFLNNDGSARTTQVCSVARTLAVGSYSKAFDRKLEMLVHRMDEHVSLSDQNSNVC